MDAAARPAEPIVDVMAKTVPAAGDREDDRRALDKHVANDDEGVLAEYADGILDVGEIGFQPPFAHVLLERPTVDVVTGVLGAHDQDVASVEDRVLARELKGAPAETVVLRRRLVRGDEVHIELFRAERASERVHLDRQRLADDWRRFRIAWWSVGAKKSPIVKFAARSRLSSLSGREPACLMRLSLYW